MTLSSTPFEKPTNSSSPTLSALQKAILAETEQHVRELFRNESSGHDWWHIHRVRQMALRIAAADGADPFVVELAALLHDIADWKFHDGDESAGPRAAREWLARFEVPAETIDQIAEIIARLSFKGAGVADEMPSLAGRVVQDADRLDAIGAVGIGRAFAFGGKFGRAMYDPATPATLHGSFAEYKAKSGPTLNHFTEKLLLLQDRMQTPTGRAIAAGRHRFLEEFLQRFLAEWDGND